MKSCTFHVSLPVSAINEQAGPAGDYPRMVESVGKSLWQYREWD